MRCAFAPEWVNELFPSQAEFNNLIYIKNTLKKKKNTLEEKCDLTRWRTPQGPRDPGIGLPASAVHAAKVMMVFGALNLIISIH